MGESLTSIENPVKALPPNGFDDWALIEQYQEELSEIKGQSSDELSKDEPEGEGELSNLYSKLKKQHFDCCHEVKKILGGRNAPGPSSCSASKVPKPKTPTFDGEILNWT